MASHEGDNRHIRRKKELSRKSISFRSIALEITLDEATGRRKTTMDETANNTSDPANRAKAPTGNASDGSKESRTHCGQMGHNALRCRQLHPEKKPKTPVGGSNVRNIKNSDNDVGQHQSH